MVRIAGKSPKERLPFGWMAFTPRLRGNRALEAALGAFDSSPVPTSDATECQALRATAAFVRGNWSELVALEDSPSLASAGLGLWLRFFRVCAERRVGGRADGKDVEREARRLGDPSLLLEIALEEARFHMARGRYPLAVAVVDAYGVEPSACALHTRFSAGNLLGTCFQAMGEFRRAESILRDQKKVLAELPAMRLRMQWLRRRASLLMEAERIPEAEAFLMANEALFFQAASEMQKVLFLHERLRLSIMRDDAATVLHLFERIDAEVLAHAMAKALLNMDEERCEVELRWRRGAAVLLPRFRQRLAANREQGDEAATCVLHFLLARVLAQKKKHAAALVHAENALALAERWRYGRTRVRCWLLLAMLHLRLGAPHEALLAAQSALGLATRMGLAVQRATAEFVVQKLAQKPISLVSLFELHRNTRSFAELRYHLDCCGLRQDDLGRVESLGATHRVGDVFREVEELVRLEAVVLVPEERTLLTLEEGRIRLVKLKGEMLDVLMLFWERRSSGVTLEALHRLRYPSVAYDPTRHRERTAMAITRLRRAVAALGVEIVYGRDDASYGFVVAKPMVLFRIESGETPLVRETWTPRQREILRIVGERGRVAMGRLCELLSVRRQTVHEILRPLLDGGVVEAVGRGKATRYRLRPREGEPP